VNAGDGERWGAVDVAIDFSLPAPSPRMYPALARRGINLVVGTTGWQQDNRRSVPRLNSTASGSSRPQLLDRRGPISGRSWRGPPGCFAPHDEFGAWIHESHHAAKKDAPSGTALMLKRAMTQAGYTRPIDVSSTRAGHIPGAHTVGFDGPAESIALSHTARDRSAFARGALVAARWVKGKRGWFTMRDVLGILGRGRQVGRERRKGER
jgi:4-hydroxy-tetrahydrodipicolinate reductase